MCPSSRPAASSRGRSARRAAARCRSRSRARHHRVRAVVRAPPARLGQQRRVGVVVHDHGQPEALAHQVAEGHVVQRQVVRPARNAGLPLHQSRDRRTRPPPPPAPPRANLLDGADEDVERLLRGRLRARSGGPGGGPPGPRRPRPPGASCPLRRPRSRAEAAWPDDIQRGCEQPESWRPPEYKVYRSRRKALRSRRQDLDALKPPAGPRAAMRERAGQSREQRRSPPGGCSSGSPWRWSAGCCSRWCSSWSAPRSRSGVSARGRARAAGRRKPPHRQHDPRARAPTPHRRLDRRDPGRARPRRLDHARARLPRERAQAVDPARHRGRDPRPGHQQDQRRLRVRRPGADDRDGGVLPRQRAGDQPPRRGRLQGLPRADRRARRCDGEQQVPHLRARRSTTSGRGSASSKGEHELDGQQALGFARVRKNDCAPGEDDRDRAARQQQVLRAICEQRHLAERVLPAAAHQLAGAAGRSGPT